MGRFQTAIVICATCSLAVRSGNFLFVVLLVSVFWSSGGVLRAGSVTLNTDTTIDASNSFPNDRVEIIDRVSGPTSVSMVAGGTVRGFDVSGSSVFEITGGAATFLSGISESATLIMRGGEIGCTAVVCQVIDYDGLLLHVNDASTLHVYGGSIDGIIALESGAQSMAIVHGTGLSLTPSPERGLVLVEGTFADGQAGFLSFRYLPDYASRILVNEIPEPHSVVLALVSLLVVAFSPRRIRARQL